MTLNATERVAALRKEYARLSENVDHLSDLELLNQEAERLAAESRRHENAYNSLLQDRVKHDRSVYAAARRSAQTDVTARAGLYLQAILRQSARPINAVVHRAAELPESGKASTQQIRDLKAAADQAKWLLSGMVGDRQNVEDATKDPEVQLVEKLNSEIRRLRDVVLEQGQALHALHSQDSARENGWRCACRGCELIRAMDDVPIEPEAVNAA
jgi:chromosome segregation ATPase